MAWHGRRTIPLNNDIIEVIKHQKRINRFLDGETEIALNEPIFKAPQRGLLMATPADREIARICKRNDIEKFTAHALRATFATRCIEQGIAPRTLQELLGHADFGLTMNLYGHVTDDTLENAMANLKIAL
jgi:integrase